MERIYYKGGYEYQLKRDYFTRLAFAPKDTIQTQFVSFTTDGALIVKKGYAWDGPSLPAIHTNNFMRGSLVHDALYQLMRLRHLSVAQYRKAADDELRRIVREDGMSWFRSNYVYLAVRWFGERAAKEPENVILVSP